MVNAVTLFSAYEDKLHRAKKTKTKFIPAKGLATNGLNDFHENGKLVSISAVPGPMIPDAYTLNLKLKAKVKVNASEIVAVMKSISKLNYTKHGNAKDDPLWGTLYQRARRDISFMDPFGNINVPSSQLWTYPCHYCGIILPEELIEVDHQMPQAHPGYALGKTLHSLSLSDGTSLTQRSAHGNKNTQASIFLGVGGGPVTPIPVNEHGFGASWKQKKHSALRDKRYSLTPEGVLVLSMMYVYWGRNTLLNLCKDSILNLAPSCRKCNGGKSDGIHVK